MYSGKVVTLLKEQATFIKARIALMWMRCLSLFYTTIDCGNRTMLTSLARRSTQMKRFWGPCHTERCELVLQLIYKHFSMFLNVDMPTLWATRVNYCIMKLTPFTSLVYTVISLQTTENHVFPPKFCLLDFLRYPQHWSVHYNNRSCNVTCYITIIRPFRYAYVKNPVNAFVLVISLGGSVT